MRTPAAARVEVVAVVALGGAVGAVGRYALTEAFPDPVDGFPWTVFTINVVGSALLALLPALAVVQRRPLLTPLLGPGVLGGFTTLSASSEQARALAAAGRTALAALYVVGTLAAALVAVSAVSRLAPPAAGPRTGSGIGPPADPRTGPEVDPLVGPEAGDR